MNPIQMLTLNHLLAARGMSGKELARAADLTESTVSRIRNGLRPSKNARERIVAAMDLTESEIRALGWEDPDA